MHGLELVVKSFPSLLLLGRGLPLLPGELFGNRPELAVQGLAVAECDGLKEDQASDKPRVLMRKITT